MKHCGMDVHLKSTIAEILDGATGEVTRATLKTEPGALRAWLAREPRMRVVLEASTVSHWVADLVEAAGHEVVVVDPNRTKAIAVAGGYKKTDRLDAAMLAWLSSKDALAPSHRPSQETRRRHRQLLLRQRLVRSRGDLVRTARATLAGEGLRLHSRKTRGFAAGVRELADIAPLLPLLEGTLRAIEYLEEEIAKADKTLRQEAAADPIVQQLQTVPGVGPVVATAYRVVVEDPRRFRHGRQVAAYLGLVPTVSQSGAGKHRLGAISKHGDSMMRSLLVEAAHTLLRRNRRPSELRDWGTRLAARVGPKKAAVAVARKLSVVLWSMWRKGTTFRVTTAVAVASA
jgi:transposase